MDHVLEFWNAGDIEPRNPFLDKSLRDRELTRSTTDEDLKGYAPTGEDGKILDDICELET